MRMCCLPTCRYENEASLFAEDYSQWSSRERMKAWDKRWSYLKSLPQVGAIHSNQQQNNGHVEGWGCQQWGGGARRHDSLGQALVTPCKLLLQVGWGALVALIEWHRDGGSIWLLGCSRSWQATRGFLRCACPSLPPFLPLLLPRVAHSCTVPQVIVTPHSAFLTKEALCNIADTTVENVRDCALGPQLRNEVKPPPAA
jgi:hypothetical protein